MVRLEKELPGLLPSLYFACRRHVLERDFNAAFRAVFPGPTKAPADELCEKIHDLHESGNMPTHLDASNKNRFRPRATIFKEQKERLASLVSKMDETREADGALPRDDYRFMLNLVAVRHILASSVGPSISWSLSVTHNSGTVYSKII